MTNAHRQSMARLKHIFGLIVSLATVVSTAACGDTSMRSTAPDPTPTPVVDTTPDFTGIWVGVSRVISCEHSAGGCANFAVGDARYLDFRLTQRGNDVTGNLSPTRGGPTVLPAVFWISGRLASGKLTFQPMEGAGASGGITSYSGEVMLAAMAPTEMVGRMTERSTRANEPLTIVWEVRTARQ